MAAVWPPPASFAEAIRSSLFWYMSVAATIGGAPVSGAQDMRPADGSGGSIVDTNKPGVRRNLKVDLPGGHDLFDRLAPNGTELTVTCVVTYNDRTRVELPMGVFDIDSNSLEEGRGLISVSAPDRWVKIQRAEFLQPVSSIPGQSVVQQIIDLIRGALGPATPVTVTATSSAAMGAITWEKDRAKAILDLAEQIGAWVYFDRFGEATIADIPTAGATARTWLADSGRVLKTLTRDRNRTSTYNVVVVESSSAEGEKFPTQIVWDDNPDSPTYAGTDPLAHPETAGPFGIVVEHLSSPNLNSADEALVAGYAHLARGLGLASQVSLGQVPNPAVDAFDAFDVLPPKDTPTDSRVIERHVADTVTHPMVPDDTSQQIEGRQTRTDL